MLTTAKLGWMAGVIDLKGRVNVKQNQQRATRQIVLGVDSRHPGIVRELGALVGTKPEYHAQRELKEFMRRGCAEHCPEQHVHVNDDRVMPSVYRWTITGVGFAIIIDPMIPLLTQDRGWAEYRDEILGNLDLNNQGAGQIIATMRRLQQLGWPMPENALESLQNKERSLLAIASEAEVEEEDGQE